MIHLLWVELAVGLKSFGPKTMCQLLCPTSILVCGKKFTHFIVLLSNSINLLRL